MRKNVILNFFRHGVVPVSKLQHRSSALRSTANGRTTECEPKCRDMHHRGRIPFSSDRNTLWEVFVEKQSTAARRRQRDKQGDYFQEEEEGAQPPGEKKKSLEFLWGAGRISWFLQQQQTGLALRWLPSLRSRSLAVNRLGAEELSRQMAAGS